MKKETPNEYLNFFENYTRAIMDFENWDDMCQSAYLYLSRQGMLVFDLDRTLCHGRVDGIEFITKLITYFNDSPETKRSQFLHAIRDELMEEKNP